MRTLLLVLLLATMAGTAQAQRFSKVTGASLVGLCTSGNARQVEACEAFIDGVSDSASFYQLLRPANGSKGSALPEYLCVPGSATGVQLREAVAGWLRSHQDQAAREASGIVLRALHDSYPCPAAAKP